MKNIPITLLLPFGTNENKNNYNWNISPFLKNFVTFLNEIFRVYKFFDHNPQNLFTAVGSSSISLTLYLLIEYVHRKSHRTLRNIWSFLFSIFNPEYIHSLLSMMTISIQIYQDYFFFLDWCVRIKQIDSRYFMRSTEGKSSVITLNNDDKKKTKLKRVKIYKVLYRILIDW